MCCSCCFANYLYSSGDVSRAKDEALSRELGISEAELSPAAAGGLQRRLDGIAAAARIRAGGGGVLGLEGGAAAAGGGGDGGVQLDDRSMEQLFDVLQEHVEGVKRLQEVMRR